MAELVPRRHGFHWRVSQDPSILNLPTRTYAIDCQGFIKLGKTDQPVHQRLSDLQTGCPFELRLLAWTTTVDERRCHLIFRELLERREWHRLSARLLDEVE